MKKLTLTNYLGYMAGDMGNNMAFALQALFLMIYYTNVVGLDPAAIATMVAVVRIYDAFADLLAGRLVDMTKSRWGKFRPYLLIASLPLLLMSVALFSVPKFDNLTYQYIYAYLTYAALGTLYSLVNIPYGSLATAMTQDPVERSRLGVWRSMGPMLSILGIVIIISPQISAMKETPDKLQSFITMVTLIFVAIGYLFYLICFFTCREQTFHEAKPVSLKETVATLKTNKPLAILCVSNFIFLVGIFGVQGGQAFYATYILGDSKYMIYMILASSLSTFVAVPLVPRLVKAYGKKSTFLIGAAGLTAVGAWIFFMPPTLAIAIPTFFAFGLFQNLSMSLLFAFEADAVEYGEYKTGKRTEGATYAIYSFFRKMSQALSASVVGYALAAGGFDKTLPEQTDAALTAIRGVVGLSPALFAVVGGLIFLAYPLTDDRFREIVRELHGRHGVVDAGAKSA